MYRFISSSMKTTVLIGAVFLISLRIAQCQIPIEIEHSFKMESKVLGELREINVSLPSGYSSGQTKYPVLYVLDGDPSNFNMISGIVSYLIRYNQIPELIVVGISNNSFASRWRDLSPTHSTKNALGAAMPGWEVTGGGRKFLSFIEKELIPKVNADYRTSPYKALLGHSLGGTLTLFAFTTNPDSFNSYISVSSSFWWDNEVMIKRMDSLLSKRKNYNQRLYMAYEKDYTELYKEEARNRKVEKFLQSNNLKGLEWKFDFLSEETHQSMLVPATHRALTYLFNYWVFGYPQETEDKTGLALIRDIEKHYATISRELQNEYIMPESWLLGYVGYFESPKYTEVAKSLCKLGIRWYPKSDAFHVSLGKILFDQKNYAEAEKMYKIALSLNPNNMEASRGLEEIRKR